MGFWIGEGGGGQLGCSVWERVFASGMGGSVEEFGVIGWGWRCRDGIEVGDGDVLSCGLALIGTGVFWRPV
jgi:hypothetical protein